MACTLSLRRHRAATPAFAAFVGISAASAGRSTPGSVPITIFAVAIAAPVFPAETKPSARAFHHELRADSQRTLLLPSDRGRDGIVHRNHFSSLNQLNAAIAIASPTTPTQFGFNLVGLAHKNNSNSEVARRSQSAVNLNVRRVVASHCVENDLARQTGLILRLTSHRLIVRFVRPAPLHDLCNDRTSGKLGVACGAHGNSDTGWSAERASASCARRLSRRAFECRRLGFGIITPLSKRLIVISTGDAAPITH